MDLKSFTVLCVVAGMLMSQVTYSNEFTPVKPGKQTAGMVFVPEGEFIVGTSEEEAKQLAIEYGVHPDLILLESPQRKVNLKAFWIDRFPVTNRQYMEFSKATDKTMKKWTDGNIPKELEDCAVVDITWPEAEEYAKWSGKRLPTAEEWEKAARGTDGRLYPWGNEWIDDATHRRPAEAYMPTDSLRSYSLPVGCFPKGASPYGVMDMCGNVPEWTATLISGLDNSSHIVKGVSATCNLKCYFRCASVIFSDTWHSRNAKGFRCAMDADMPQPENYKLEPLPSRTVPPFPQPQPPREDLYLKQPILLAADGLLIPYLPEGKIGFIAPEGAELNFGDPNKWFCILRTPNSRSSPEISADGTSVQREWLFSSQSVIMRTVFESHLDYVDYKLTIQNISDSETRVVRTNTCMQARLPYIYDQEDTRTFIVTDSGLTPFVKCPPFGRLSPLHRPWPILPEGKSTGSSTLPSRLPFVCTVSTDGRWTLAVAAAEGTGLSRNSNYSCLHLSQEWPEIKPNEEHTILTRYYVIRGGAQDALDRFKKDRASGDLDAPASKGLTPFKPKEHSTKLPLNTAYSPIDLSPYANRGFMDEKANDGKGGWSDQGPECDLRDFPTGLQRFNGVPFLIGKEPHSCIVLRSKSRPFPETLPESVTIPVGCPVEGFSFLHTGTYTGEGAAGTYQIQYDDGSTFDIPLIGEVNIRDWVCLPGPFTGETCTQSRNAWTGATKIFPDVTVSQMLWINPKPDIPVKSVKFDNPERSACPILIGLTAVIKGDKTEAGIRSQHTAAADLLARGQAALDAGKNVEAREFLQKGTIENPSLEDAYRLLGEACERMNDESAALKAYQAWADAGTTTTLPFNKMGEILERKGDMKGALDAYRQSFCLDWKQPQVINSKFRLEELLKKNQN